MKHLKKIMVSAILLMVLTTVLIAGCVSNEEPIPSQTEEIIIDDPTSIVGFWKSVDYRFSEVGDKYSTLSLTFNEDGTGVAKWQSNGGMVYSEIPLIWGHSSDPTLFIVQFGNGRNQLYILGDDGSTLSNDSKFNFKRAKEDTSTQNFDKLPSGNHLEADYVESGDYYLEDAIGKSFTETLWAGDVSKYVSDYNKVNAGKWIIKVREMSLAHHAFENNENVVYQTVDTTMNWGASSCCDLAILAARGLKEIGYDVCILIFPDHMDIGVNKKDIGLLKGQIDTGYYGIYAKSGIMYDDYYYINIADFQNILDVGTASTESKLVYDITLEKLIVL